MRIEFESPDLCIRDTGTDKGNGVYARRSFGEGETVEIAPVLVMKAAFSSLPAALKTYAFDWTALTGIPGRQALPLGYGSMYNHANPANLRYVADPRAGVMRYVAVRKINAGEELTINYNAKGGGHVCDDDNWFERQGVAVINSTGGS